MYAMILLYSAVISFTIGCLTGSVLWKTNTKSLMIKFMGDIDIINK